MSESEQTKVCRRCAETIKAAAKVCPYCRSSQTRWLFVSKHEVIPILTLLLFAGTAWLIFFYFSQSERRFSPSRDRIEILSSQVTIQKTKYGQHVVVVGVLTNQSPYAWLVGDFSVRYFDKDGKTLDVDSSIEVFTVLPHSDHSFRLSFESRKSIPEYTNHKVYVRKATDPKAWWL